MTDSPPRALVAEPSAVMRAALAGALADGGIEVTVHSRSAAEAVEQARNTGVDAVLLGLGLPGARRAVSALRDTAPAVAVVLFGEDPGEAALLGFVAAGAHGILLGATDPARIPVAIHGVLAGESAFPRRLVRVMADELAGRQRARARLRVLAPNLTARECDVLEALAAPAAPAAVASRLGISPATVRRHCANAVHKLGVPDRDAALALLAKPPAAA